MQLHFRAGPCLSSQEAISVSKQSAFIASHWSLQHLPTVSLISVPGNNRKMWMPQDSQTHPGNKNSWIHWWGISIYFSFLIAFCSVFGQVRKDRKGLLSYFYLWGTVCFLQWLYNDFMLLANVDKLLCLLIDFNKAHQNLHEGLQYIPKIQRNWTRRRNKASVK